MLEAHGLSYAYGSVQVLFDVDVAVRDAEIVSLLGTNGAGKSTLLDLFAGLAVPSAGRIVLDGEDVTRLGAAGMVRRGVVLVQGGRAVFPDLTVLENLEVGVAAARVTPSLGQRRIADVLERFPVLRDLAARRAKTLSGGEQQQLAIAKGVAAEPRVLLIDELSLGLSPEATEHVARVVREVHAGGATVVLVEQRLDVATALTERSVFMEKGTVRFDGPSSSLLERSDLSRAVFLGTARP